jgi:hypothetical protein
MKKFRALFTLLLLASLLAALLGLVRVPSAHAQSTITVSNCDESHLDAAISQANSDNAGDTVTFSCSGDIKLTSTLTISGSMTLDGNGQSVTLDGQNKVEVLQVNSGVTFTLNALTVARGSASGGGGGIENDGTVSITNSTFANNSALALGGAAGGGLAPGVYGGSGRLSGSLVADNTGGNCSGGGISDQGYNLESGMDCGFTGTGDLQNADPRLASALANNGGPTQTLALEPDSPAIDQIPKSICPPTDQRGVSRPQGPTSCDIGAFELKATEGITELIAIVNSFGLSSGLQTSLDAKLKDALTSINAGQTATACSDLSDFINQVKAKTNKGISPSQAAQLIKTATNLQGVLGC